MNQLHTTMIAFSLLGVWISAQSVELSGQMSIVAEGEFIAGSHTVDSEQLGKQYGSKQPFFENEHPERSLSIPGFMIDRHEVTVQEYREYLLVSKQTAPRYWLINGYALSMKIDSLKALQDDKLFVMVQRFVPLNNPSYTREELLSALQKHWNSLNNLPVEYVSWHQANAYCQYKGKRLPRELEWEKAARGKKASEFPWGMQWHEGWSNNGNEQWPFNVAPVGSYAKDVSSYGVYDLAGNVSEWVADWYQPYPGNFAQDPDYGEKHKVVRGGAFGSTGHYTLEIFARGAFRKHLPPDDMKAGLGFRCAKDIN